MQRPKTPREEPLLIQRKIFLPEVQRISSVIKNCISQVEIAASLPAVLQLNAESKILDEELRTLLQKHQTLAEKVEALEGLKQEDHEEQDEEAVERKSRAKAQLDKDAKNSVRDVLRFFRVHPDVVSGLLELSLKNGGNEDILIRSLKVFHSHMLEKLQAGPDEHLQPLFDEQTLSCLAENLKQIIQQEEVIAAAMVAEENIEKQTLQNAQRGINGPDAASAPIEKQLQLLLQTHNQKQTSMQQEMDRLNAKLYDLMLENRQAERALQEKNGKVEMEIEYLLQSFDNDIEEIQANLESNEEIYEKEQEEVRKLEEPFAILEKEYNQILERRQLAEEKRQEELRELELKTKAALYAQAWWRGYCTRKALKNKSKSKKAKKGKGKKTK